MPKKKLAVKRSIQPVMHIFCEGEKTEPNYLNGYLEYRHPGKRRADIVRIEKTDKNTPQQLVDEAVKLKQQSPLMDTFWVVYDRESKNKYPARIHMAARKKADDNGISIAFSNVCFEVWILLHFEKHFGSFQSYKDLWKRSRLRVYLPNYDKGCRNLYNVLNDKVEDAIANAKQMNKQTHENADHSWIHHDQWNPYSDFAKLLSSMDDFLTQ